MDNTDTFEFQCDTCGEIHQGVPTFGWDCPISVFDVPPEERDGRVELGSDECIIDDKWFFIRGCIEIPIIGLEESFIWGEWVSISEENYEKFADLYNTEGREKEPPFFGWLNHMPPSYPFQELHKTMVYLQPLPARPKIELYLTDHPLSIEQRNGITVERLKEIVEIMLHPKSH
jgi:hypothetical protein